MTSCSNEIRRCRPLLGTYVEIAVGGTSESQRVKAIEAAFAVIERVQQLMSFYEAGSDVSRLNQTAARRPVKVNAWTWQVLQAAKEMHGVTHGAFDVTIAPQLQRWGYLPGNGATRAHVIDQSAIELMAGNRVRFRRPVQIDLGGIAKGFAVDQAIEALQASGVGSARVNAGGDLRVCGPESAPIHVRHPASPGQLLALGRITNAAVATSAGYFSRKRWHGRSVTPLLDPVRQRACRDDVSVTVQAPTCLLADALTKAVLILGERSADVLKACSAVGYVVRRNGTVTATIRHHAS